MIGNTEAHQAIVYHWTATGMSSDGGMGDYVKADKYSASVDTIAELVAALRQVTELAEFGTTGAETNPPCKSRALTEQQATSLRGSISTIARAALQKAQL
jgi:hypothetical protein